MYMFGSVFPPRMKGIALAAVISHELLQWLKVMTEIIDVGLK